MTDFSVIYNKFLSKITDDMYLEITEEETMRLQQELLINALPFFEFPRVDLEDYDLEAECFAADLTNEEINIIATYMVVTWYDQQLATIELARMKYSGQDFKMSSQGAHMGKVQSAKKEYERVGFHLQRLYSRRAKNEDGIQKTTMAKLMDESPKGRFTGFYGA